MKGREINWKIYLVIDSQEHSMLFCAQMKPGVVSKKKQFAPYAARSIDRAIVSYVLHFERKTRETREPFLLLLLLASIRIPRMCSDEIFPASLRSTHSSDP